MKRFRTFHLLLIVMLPALTNAQTHPIHQAAEEGDIARVQQLLTEDPGLLDQQDNEGGTALHHAAGEGNFELVDLLLGKGADLEIKDNYQSPPLHSAIIHRQAEMASHLIDAGADIDARGYMGASTLMLTIMMRQPETGDRLIERGAVIGIFEAAALGLDDRIARLIEEGSDPNSLDGSETSPLSYAVRYNHPETIRLLLDSGANINPAEGGAPLGLAASRSSAEVVQLLIDLGASLESRDGQGDTPLQVACRGGRLEIVERLLDSGAYINTKNDAGDTPLHTTAGAPRSEQARHYEIVGLLLSEGARLNIKNNKSVLPLDAALEANNKDIIDFLVEEGALGDLRGEEARNTLHKAALAGQGAIVDLMIEKGVDEQTNNDDGGTLLHSAARGGLTETVRSLLQQDFEIDAPDLYGRTPLYLAADSLRRDVVDLLVSGEADVNRADSRGRTPLHRLAWDGNTGGAGILIARNADVDRADNDGNTPLHLAAKNGHQAFLEAVLDAGADMDRKNRQGDTPLHSALMNLRHGAASILIEKGAPVKGKNREGNTPLHLASAARFHDLTETILGRGANVNKKNRAGETPLHIASASWANSKTIDRLVSAGARLEVRSNSGLTPVQTAERCLREENKNTLIAAGAEAHTPSPLPGNADLALPADLSLQPGDWPRWRGSDADGIYKFQDWNPEALSDGPDILWQTNIGFGHGAVVTQGNALIAMGNRIVTTATDTTSEEVVFCLDTETGRERWHYAYACPEGAQFPGPESSACIDGSRVYAYGRAGFLCCLELETGRALWTLPVVGEGFTETHLFGISASPVVEGDLLLVNGGRSGLALNKYTGEVVWKSEPQTSGYATPVFIDFRGKRTAVIQAEKALHFVALETGEVQWTYPWVTLNDPVFVDDMLFLSAGREGRPWGISMLRKEGDIYVEAWNLRKQDVAFQNWVVFGGHAYGIFRNRRHEFRCIDLETGNIEWKQDLGEWGSLIGAGGRLIIITGQGELVIAEAVPDEFRVISRARVLPMPDNTGIPHPEQCFLWTHPVLSGGLVYVRNSFGDLVCVNLRK